MKTKIHNTITILVLSFFFSFSLHSQTWCPPGATWHYTDVGLDMDGYSKLTYSKDTLINSINCKKITHYFKRNTFFFGIIEGYQPPHFTYSENGVVYIYNNLYGNSKFDTLFDINAQKGSRWRQPLIDTACADSLYFIKVLNTGNKVINGFTLKWLYVKMGPFDEHGTANFDTITERFGLRYDDLDYSLCRGLVAEVPHGDLRCYADDEFGFHSTGLSTSCDYYYTSIPELERYGIELTLYPNPVNEKLTIQLNNKQSIAKKLKLELYDLTGKHLLSVNMENNPAVTQVSMLSLEDGMYMYRLLAEDMPLHSGKLTVVH